ncbi:MAG: DUF309 domain-containing protein [Deltaproteobacteria bacterium]|nr:MAG: DUF309 domain-containing protein [Deltaproteobacteria bacterium]
MPHPASRTHPNAELPPPRTLPARRVELPWPPYRYVPGLHPHPLRCEGGHSGSGLPAEATIALAYARGLDLLGGHYVWEAHEAFEHAWRRLAPPARAPTAALIKICAALLRAHLGDPIAAGVLIQRAQTQGLHPDFLSLLHATERFVETGSFPAIAELLPPSTSP